MAGKTSKLPFLPKSTAYLEVGMIWSITLRDGSFACGRVLCLDRQWGPRSRNLFWGGLLNWHSSELPTVETIAGSPVLWQGNFNVSSLANDNSEMLDLLPLHEDGLVIPPILTTLMNGEVWIGYNETRAATKEEFRTLPVMTVQVSNESFREIAEDVFLDGKPMKWSREKHSNDFLDSIGMESPEDLDKVERKLSGEWWQRQKP